MAKRSDSKVRPLSMKEGSTAAEADAHVRLAGRDAGSKEPGFFEYLGLLVYRKWTVLGAATLFLVGAGLYSFASTPVYSAKATLQIEPTTPKVLSNVTEVTELGPSHTDRQYYETQYRILASASLLQEVVERANLKSDPTFLQVVPKVEEGPRNAGSTLEELAEELKERLSVKPIKDSQLVTVEVLDHDPKRAAVLANWIGDVYLERNAMQRTETTREAVAWLKVQMQDLKRQLEESEEQLDRFKRANNLLSVSLSDRQNVVAVEIEMINRSLTETRIKRMDLGSRASSTTGEAAASGRTSPDVVRNTSVQRLLDRLATLREELAEIATRYETAHPKYLMVKSRIQALEEHLRQRVQDIVTALNEEFKETTRLEEELTYALAAAKERAHELSRVEIGYNRLLREYESNKTLHNMVFSRLRETDLAGMLETNNARFLDRAAVPTEPVKPMTALNLVLGLLLGLLAGCALALLLAFSDDTLKSQSDLQDAVGVAFLGMLPTLALGKNGRGNWPSKGEPKGEAEGTPDLFVHNNPKSPAAEACRAIRSNLVFMSPDRPIRTVAISSAETDAGKTTTAIQLAVLMAQTQGKTLLVDADMRKGRLHAVFGLNNGTGLSTVIAGESPLLDSVRKVQIPCLEVLSCGRMPPNPSELLHSRRFADVVAEMSREYGLVVFDTPPLLTVTDAVILGRHVDGVTLVARWGKTQREALHRAASMLADIGIPIFGAVINDIDLRRKSYAYYYYRSYGKYGAYSYGVNE